MSWNSSLQEALKLLRVAALNKKTVWIAPLRQMDASCRDALGAKAAQPPLRRGLPASVAIGVEGQIDSPGAVAQLLKLSRI
jgi:hypothetical protein